MPRFHRQQIPGSFSPRFLLISVCLCLFLAAGCAAQSTPVSETATQVPTAAASFTPEAAAPVEVTATPASVEQSTPIVIMQPTAATPSGTAEVIDISGFPTNPVNILTPGTGSRIISPLQITAFALPGHGGKVTLQLWGEDARLMGEQLVRLGTETKWITFESKIPFEITSAGESAVLTLSTFDEFSRPIAVNSIDLILLQVGNSVIESNSMSKQPIYIRRPVANAVITNGVLHIEGYAHPFSSAPVIIELVKTNGAIVASKQIALGTPTEGNDYAPFSVDIPYSVSESTPVRLTLRQGNDKPPLVDLVLASQLITLKP